LPAGIAADYPHLAEIYDRISSREELLAYCWAIQNFFALEHARDFVCMTAYESLVCDSETELTRIFAYLGIPMPVQARQQLNKPSQTARASSTVTTGKDPLTFWKQELRSDQIDSILSIAHRVGVKCYGDNPLPVLSANAVVADAGHASHGVGVERP
ncbi:MAG: hypothetical protein KDA42_15905, partial [Planctomycetales bacterium]|nr:hypothetical protein [Planctomycetales bacterium]